MAADATKITKRLDALKSKRSQYENDWRDCFDLTFPERGSGFSGDVIDTTQARTKVAARLDSTGTDSARILASALVHSRIMESRSFFKALTQQPARWMCNNFKINA